MSKSNLSPIEKQVQLQLDRHFPGKLHPTFVAGISGGADSMCLMAVLHKLGVDLRIVHVNYQKRGAESDADAQLVKTEAARLGIDFKVITVEPEKAGDTNFQQWAREVRYKAFEIKAEEVGADSIVTAHHQDDQIETILQKIFRGGGLASWSAMRVWNGRVFRPLLEVSRDEIEQYCREQSTPYRDDASNFESDFARNFLRNEWMPELEQHFPGWRNNVLRVKEQAYIFDKSLQFILQHISDDKDRLNRKLFLGLDENLQKSVLLYYAYRLEGHREISRHALNELTKLEHLQTGKSIQLTENLELMRDREYLKLVVDSGDSVAFLELTKGQLQQNPISFNGLKIAIEFYEDPNFDRTLYLDVHAMEWPLRVRQWRKGDRFQPLGMEGHQNVAEHLANRKVSAAAKGRALVIESFEETICAVIFPPIENRVPPGTISEVVKCSPSTRKCLTFNMIQN